MVVEVPLTHGKIALIDHADLWLVEGHKWYAIETKAGWYAAHPGCDSPITYMHRLITGALPGQYVDFTDRNTLNNCRSNLRVCTQSQNMGNMRKPNRKAGNTSRFKGVSWCKPKRRWFAAITVRGRMIALGRYRTEEEAARAYNEAALLHFGIFARTNLAI